MPKTSSNEGAFLVSETPHIGKAQGRGTGGGGGVLADPTVVLTSGRRFLLREHRTQRGALDCDCGDFWVRRLA